MAGLTREASDRGLAPERAERTRLLTPLVDDVEALAAKAIAAMRTELPAYAGRNSQFSDDVVDQICRNYTAILRALLDDRAPTADDLSFQRGASMRRARAGFALEDYLSAYRVGQQVLWDSIVDVADRIGVDHHLVLRLASQLMRHIDFATTHAAQAYVEFRQYGLADAARERRDLLEHLLDGNLPTDGALSTAAERYGLGETTPALVAVALGLGPDYDNDGSELASLTLARAGLDEASGLAVIRHSEIVVILRLGRAREPEEVCDRLERAQERLRSQGTPMAIGVSTIATGVATLPEAYREAAAAVRFVGKDGGLSALTRLSPFEYLALNADATARRLIDPRLQAFLDDDRRRGGVLVATIRGYVEADLSVKGAATRLHIHANTAHYRFQRITELTGLNPRRFEDLHALLVAIALGHAAATTPS